MPITDIWVLVYVGAKRTFRCDRFVNLFRSCCGCSGADSVHDFDLEESFCDEQIPISFKQTPSFNINFNPPRPAFDVDDESLSSIHCCSNITTQADVHRIPHSDALLASPATPTAQPEADHFADQMNFDKEQFFNRAHR